MSERENKNVARHCPICSNPFGDVLHRQEFYLESSHPLPAAYDVIACRQCGFVYADTAASQEQYDRFYRDYSKYETVALATGGGATGLDAQRLEETAADIALQISDKNAAILDIGCANGGLLAVLQRKGYRNLTGLDPAPACVAYVAQQGIRAYLGGLFSDSTADEASDEQRYDCIILSHVLEHVCDLQKAVRNLLARLKEHGVIYVEVPDSSRYHDYYIVPYYYFDCEHINHFDEHSLNNLFTLHGCSYLHHRKKEIVVAGNKRYPAVYAMFRNTGKMIGSQGMVFHDTVITSVQHHIHQSVSNAPNTIFDALQKEQEPLVIWGAGSHALRLMKNTPLGKCNVRAFVDKDLKKQGTYIGMIQVHDPGYLVGFVGTVVVCSALHGQEIADEIRHMGITNPIVMTN